MPYNPQLSIQGVQEVMARNNRRIATMETGGAAEDAVRDAIIALHRHVVQIIHVDTGTLRASQRMEVDGLEGMVFIDPSARNPRGKTRPVEYGVYEHARGGEHAFYDRTQSEIGEQVKAQVTTKIKEAVIYAK
jgi:hypothetical protein